MRLRADRGTFLLYSGATYLNFDREVGGQVAQAFGRHSNNGMVTNSEVNLRGVSASLLTAEQLEFFLAKQHERDHFDNFFSSPLGVLIFRCYQTLATTGTWLFSRFFVPGGLTADVALDRPLKDWILNEGRDWIRERIMDGRIAVPGEGIEELRPADQKRGVLGYLESQVYTEIASVSQFLDVLLHRAPAGFTRGQFADLANRVFKTLSVRGDVPWTQQWTTQAPDLELHPAAKISVLSTTELFELSALIQEFEVLRQTGADAQVLAQWYENYAESPYREGLSLAQQFDIPLPMLDSLVRTALHSPCDIVFNAGGPLRVESLLPSWRFHDLLRCLIDRAEFPNPGDTLQMRVERWGEALGTSSATAEAVLSQLAPTPVPTWAEAYPVCGNKPVFGPGARMLPAKPDDFQVLDARHGIQFAVDTFATCMAAAAQHDWDMVKRVKERILYCEDEATLPGLASTAQVEEHIGTHITVVTGFLQLTVMLEGVRDQAMPPFTRSITARVARLFEDDDLGNLAEYLRTDVIAELCFGQPFARAMTLS
jgi:hypothetical protein